MSKKITIYKVKPNKIDKLRGWFSRLRGPKHFAALTAFEKTRAGREFGSLIKIAGQDYAIFFEDWQPLEMSAAGGGRSDSNAIEREHQKIKQECLIGPAREAPLAYDLTNNLW